MTALPEVAPEVLAQAHQAMMRASPAYFANKTLIGPPEPPYNGRFLIGRHHLEWDKLATGQKNVCVMASRNIGKSFYFSLACPLFFAWNQPGGLTFIVGATQDNAQRIMGDITHQLLINPKLAWLVPTGAAKRDWNKQRVQLSNGHTITCAGMGKRMRGLHPDNIIGDDLLTDDDATSETVRQKTISYFFSALTPMLGMNGRMLVVGTPQSQRDLLVGHLKDNPGYHFRVYPARKDGVPLWPERLSNAFLDKTLATVGAIRFAREFECTPVNTGSSLFPHDLFQGEPVEQYGLTLGMPSEHWAKSGMSLYTGVDIAMSSGVGADYTVVMTIAIDSHGNTWVVDIQRVKGMPYHEQLALIKSVGEKYKPAVIAVESNQAQRFVADELIRTTNLPVVRHTTTAAKHSLEHGLPSLKLMLENRKLRLPRGDDHSIKMTDLLAEEFNGFTFLNGRVQSVGEHDDLPMAYFIAVQAQKLGTFNVSFGPDIVLSTGQPVPPTPQEMAAKAPQPIARVDPLDPFGMRPRA